jgi:hypothetical protein
MRLKRESNKKRLRKQPKLRRVESATFVSQPKLRVPKTAKQRKRRNNRRVHLPVAGIKAFVFSSRWLSLGLLAFVVFAIYLVGSDEKFYLTTIPVDGTTSIPASEVVAASNLAGMHIFATDPNEAAQRITAVPGIISAAVTVQWPNQVSIAVTEDTPIAVWFENGKSFWVTHGGSLIPARSEAMGMLVIESEIPAEVAVVPEEVTDAAETDSEAQVAFVPPEALAGAQQLRQLRPNIERLYYQPGSGLSYQDGRGWRAYFGTGTDMTQKLVVYETIIEDLLGRGITPAYVSVANQERPFYKGQ